MKLANSSRCSIVKQRSLAFCCFPFEANSRTSNMVTTRVQHVRRQSHLKLLQIWRVPAEGRKERVYNRLHHSSPRCLFIALSLRFLCPRLPRHDFLVRKAHLCLASLLDRSCVRLAHPTFRVDSKSSAHPCALAPLSRIQTGVQG
jgi:hypothetical protein